MEDKIICFQFEPVSAKPDHSICKIPEVTAFCLEGKASFSWNTAALEFTKAGVFRKRRP